MHFGFYQEAAPGCYVPEQTRVGFNPSVVPCAGRRDGGGCSLFLLSQSWFLQLHTPGVLDSCSMHGHWLSSVHEDLFHTPGCLRAQSLVPPGFYKRNATPRQNFTPRQGLFVMCFPKSVPQIWQLPVMHVRVCPPVCVCVPVFIHELLREPPDPALQTHSGSFFSRDVFPHGCFLGGGGWRLRGNGSTAGRASGPSQGCGAGPRGGAGRWRADRKSVV